MAHVGGLKIKILIFSWLVLVYNPIRSYNFDVASLLLKTWKLCDTLMKGAPSPGGEERGVPPPLVVRDEVCPLPSYSGDGRGVPLPLVARDEGLLLLYWKTASFQRCKNASHQRVAATIPTKSCNSFLRYTIKINNNKIMRGDPRKLRKASVSQEAYTGVQWCRRDTSRLTACDIDNSEAVAMRTGHGDDPKG